MDITQAVKAASRSPQFEPALRALQEELSDVPAQQLDELIKLMEFALQRPDQYPRIRAAAIADDMAEPGDLPEQFDPVVLAAVLTVLYRLRDGAQNGETEQLRMARGGLAQMRKLAARGRMGDTMLAHISPEEAAMLRARGGAGTINPNTGLTQYFSLKKVLGAVLPIALTIIAPGIGTAIGTALGATGAAATALGGAVIGGVSSGLTGGNVLQGAVLGGLGGGLGGMAGGAASNALGLGLGQTGQALLGGALIGGATGALTGQGFAKGALMGGLGAGVGALGQGAAGQMGGALGSGTQVAGNMLTAGYRPQEALAGGTLAGLAAGIMPPAAQTPTRPSDMVVDSLRTVLPETGGVTPMRTGPFESAFGPQPAISAATQGRPPFAPTASPMPAVDSTVQALAPLTSSVTPTAAPASGLPANLGTRIGQGLMLASLLGSKAPPAVQQAIGSLPPAQQEYFARPGITWDWDRMQADAAASNMSLPQFMAANWSTISGYGQGDARQGAYAQPAVRMAMGGALNAVARFARGAGSGRDDTIHAKLSDGEYVMDAETVAMLGDGSNEEGARRLDAMRANIRKHKGRTLAKGKFSPNAKKPMAYLSGVAR